MCQTSAQGSIESNVNKNYESANLPYVFSKYDGNKRLVVIMITGMKDVNLDLCLYILIYIISMVTFEINLVWISKP